MKLFVVTIIMAFLFSCNEPSNKHEIKKDLMAQFSPDTSTLYFPVDTFKTTGILEDWANKVLLSLNEPDFKSYLGEGNFIRLTWLRAFENPIVIRINKFGDTAYVALKENSFSLNSPENDKLLKDTIINIDKKEWNQFIDQINKSDYWNSQYSDSILGKDGAIWFLECRTNERYKVIQRWDDGYLSSKGLKQYASNLIEQLSKYAQLKSSR